MPLVITIGDPADGVVEALADYFGYQPVDDQGQPNTETRDDFVAATLPQWILSQWQAYEQRKLAAEAARTVAALPVPDITVETQP